MSTHGRKREPKQGGSKTAEQQSSSIAKLPESERAAIVASVIRDDPGVLQNPVVKETVVAMMAKSHSGPLPAPEDFAAYETALPGACDRILKMAETQQSQFFELNKLRISGDFREARRGQICAMILGLVGLGFCAWTAYFGAAWQVSASLGAAGVGLLIAPFFRRQG